MSLFSLGLLGQTRPKGVKYVIPFFLVYALSWVEPLWHEPAPVYCIHDICPVP
jgi:hypothetical protein